MPLWLRSPKNQIDNQIVLQPDQWLTQKMSQLSANLIVLVVATVVFWWLSGFDPRLSGIGNFPDLLRRGIRCAVALLVVEGCFLIFWRFAVEKSADAGYLYLVIAMPLAFLWSGCLSQLGARCFDALFDPDDPRHFHPDKEARLLNKIGELIRHGKKSQAIQLCKRLKASGQVSSAALEMTLEHLGVPQNSGKILKPLAIAHRLRQQGKFNEAASMLNLMLAENPRDVDAAMPLMRLYALDLHQPKRARKILRDLENQPHMAASHLEFARQSIEEWCQPQPKPADEEAPAGSVDELMAQGFIGTAIEMLEEQVEAQPENFDLQLKLAEFYARQASNLSAAERIVGQMDGKFSPEQLQIAQARLKEWQLRK
jgi:tetratricopeptide (TPR) repeat protein